MCPPPEGVRWHDDEPFTAADVAFTYTMLVDPRAGRPLQIAGSSVLGAEEYARGEASSVAGLDVIDDHTIAFELAEPHFGFLATMGYPLVPEHILGDVGEGEEIDDTEFALRAPIGTGPFRLAAHVPDGGAELVANTFYWGGSPQVDRLILKRLDDEEALEAFERARSTSCSSMRWTWSGFRLARRPGPHVPHLRVQNPHGQPPASRPWRPEGAGGDHVRHRPRRGRARCLERHGRGDQFAAHYARVDREPCTPMASTRTIRRGQRAPCRSRFWLGTQPQLADRAWRHPRPPQRPVLG